MAATLQSLPRTKRNLNQKKKEHQKYRRILLKERDSLYEESKKILRESMDRERFNSEDMIIQDPELTRIYAISLEKSNRLRAINLALTKIETDEYGICIACDEKIEELRLGALPFAQRCKDCQEKIEKKR